MGTMLLVILAGVVCGFMNTVASSGSAVTLPILMALGLPPAVANGTNRVPVFLGALIATLTFMRAGVIQWRFAIKVLVPSVAGAIVGTLIADQLPPAALELLIVVAVIVALLLLFTNIKHALSEAIEQLPRYRWQEAMYLLGVGFWMGFIVLDSATYLLMVLILSMRLSLVTANAHKNLVLMVATGIALVLMALQGNVDWNLGGLLALGSIIGAYAGAKFAMHALAKKWTYRFLVMIISLELIHIAFGYMSGFLT
jgi:uncharacterized membrane protein YfcA